MTQPKREASRETLERLAEAAVAYHDRDERWDELKAAMQAYRAETTPPLRTRAEVDAEIADAVRHNGPLPHTQHGAVWEIRGAFPERLMALCAEPTAPDRK